MNITSTEIYFNLTRCSFGKGAESAKVSYNNSIMDVSISEVFTISDLLPGQLIEFSIFAVGRNMRLSTALKFSNHTSKSFTRHVPLSFSIM